MNAAQAAATSAGPRTPSPSLPISSGSFSSAAAPMIGVASRNAKRAASRWESPTSRLPPIVAPAREKPGMSAIACAAPTANAPAASRPAPQSARRRRRPPAAPRRRRRSATSRSTPLAIRERRGRGGRGEERSAACPGSKQPDDPGGDRAEHEQPRELRVDVGRGRCRGRAASGRALARCAPSRARKSRAGRAPSRDAWRPERPGSTDRSWWMFQPSRRGRITTRARGSRSGRAPPRP